MTIPAAPTPPPPPTPAPVTSSPVGRWVALAVVALVLLWLIPFCVGRHTTAGRTAAAHAEDVDTLLRDQRASEKGHAAATKTADSLARASAAAVTTETGERTRAASAGDSTTRMAAALRAMQRAPRIRPIAPLADGPQPVDVPAVVIAPPAPLAVGGGDTVSWAGLYDRRTAEVGTLDSALVQADTARAQQMAADSVTRADDAREHGRADRLDTALAVQERHDRCTVLVVPCPSRTEAFVGGAIVAVVVTVTVILVAHH